MATRRLNVTLDPEHAEKLSRMAERSHVPDGTLARSLLSTAIDEAPDGATMTEILEGIPGALDAIERAEAQVREGRTMPLEDL